MREKRAACALALGLLTLGLFGCAAKAGTAPELLEPVGVRMDTEAVVRGEIAEWRAYDAFVVPETTELFLTQSGEIQEICVQLGEEVGAGQVLLRLDVEAERERIAQIDQELAYLEADNALTLEQMQLDIDLCKYQMEDDNRDYKAGGEREALKENEQLLKERETLAARVAASELAAPQGGRVVYLAEVANGAVAQSGQTLVVLAREDALQLRSDYLTEAEVDAADEVVAWIGGERVPVEYAAMDTDEYVARLLAGDELDAGFTFPEGAPAQAKAGDYAAVILKTVVREDALLVPPESLFRDGGETYVYRVVDGERVRTEVEAGYRSVNAAEIVSGLAEGDVVYVP